MGLPGHWDLKMGLLGHWISLGLLGHWNLMRHQIPLRLLGLCWDYWDTGFLWDYWDSGGITGTRGLN